MGTELLLVVWLLIGQDTAPKQVFLREEACRIATTLQPDTICVKALVAR